MAALMAGALPPLHQDASSIPVSKWDSNPLLPATVWVPQTQIVHFQPHMIRTTYTCLIPILGPMLWVSTSAQVRQSSLGFLNVGFGLLGPLSSLNRVFLTFLQKSSLQVFEVDRAKSCDIDFQ